MADFTPASFRITEDDKEKFKNLTKEFGFDNQAEAFTELINTWEMTKAKNSLGDRAKEIETFQITLTRLGSMFINSLETNLSSEERIREEVALELNTKDKTINNLQEQLDKLKLGNNNLKDTSKDIGNKNNVLQEQLDKSIKENGDKANSLEIANRNNTNLQDQLAEYKEFKNENVTLKKQLEHLQATINEKENDISNLNNNVKQLEDKIKNDTDMISFYKEQLDTSKDEIKDLNKSILEKEKSYKEEIKELEEKSNVEISSYKDQLETLREEIKDINNSILDKEKYYKEGIKELEDKSKSEILELKDVHKNSMNEKIEQLDSRCELALGKKDLVIEKLENELEQLKNKNTKASKKIQDKE